MVCCKICSQMHWLASQLLTSVLIAAISTGNVSALFEGIRVVFMGQGQLELSNLNQWKLRKLRKCSAQHLSKRAWEINNCVTQIGGN